mgnify:CR=1 FL=1
MPPSLQSAAPRLPMPLAPSLPSTPLRKLTCAVLCTVPTTPAAVLSRRSARPAAGLGWRIGVGQGGTHNAHLLVSPAPVMWSLSPAAFSGTACAAWRASAPARSAGAGAGGSDEQKRVAAGTECTGS